MRVVEKAATDENGATNEREEADNSRLLGRTKVATLRVSCPLERERERERQTDRQSAEGKGYTRARAARTTSPR